MLKRKFLSVLATVVLILSILSSLSLAASNETTEKKPVIIMFKDRADADLVKQHGGTIKNVYRIFPAMAASLPQSAIDALQINPKIAYIVPDLPIKLVSETLPWGVERIGAPLVHAVGNKGIGINVAILDTGIDKDHPDLRYVYGYDFSGANDPDPKDFDGHGTHVAGIVAALDNDIGVIGVAPEANLYILKIFTDSGSGSYSDAVEAIEWCIGTHLDDNPGNDIQIISMSWGSEVQYGDPGIEPWIDEAYSLGILLVGAAGNSGNIFGSGDNVIYPARYENVIAVAATDNSDTRAWWSSTGPAVELAAPGVSIPSTYLSGGYTTLSGTSMACPHVSGTAALVFASAVDPNYDDNNNGTWDNAEVRRKLQDTADDLGAAGRDSKYGYGLVDADGASGIIPPTKKMHVGDISMWYSKKGAWYTVYTKVPILDDTSKAVSGATVYLDTTLPGGSKKSFSGKTGSDGTVTFSVKSKLTGTYTSTVTNVVKEGWSYDSSGVISKDLTIP